jgi:peptide/nickel transport system substrate-binding protein
MRRKLGWFSAIVVIALSVPATMAGASVKEASSSGGDVCTAKRVGGTVTIGNTAINTTLDPATRNFGGTGGAVIQAGLYDTLLRLDPTTGKVLPYLAQSYTHNADYTQFTLKLRPGIKFGDGNPFNAAAVVGAQNRYLTGFAFTGFNAYISSIVATDNLTVQYNLKIPWSELGPELSQTFGMIADPAVAAKLGAGLVSAVNTGAGVGPYDVTTFNPPTLVVMKAKSDYWQGPVCIQEIRNTTFATQQQGLDSFNHGEYQLAVLRDPVVYQQYATAKPRVGTQLPTLDTGAAAIVMNSLSKSAHLDDARVRQAIQYANDVKTINQRGFQGSLIPHTSLVPKQLGIVKPTDGPQYDPAKAKKLLDQVKSETGWDGSIRLLCATSSADFGVALAAVLDNVGFKVNLDTTLGAAAASAKSNIAHDYDLFCGALESFNGDLWDPLYVRTVAQPNQAQWNNVEWSAAMNALAANPIGTPAYQSSVNKLQQLANKLAPIIPVGSFRVAVLLNKVHGVELTHSAIPLLGRAYLSSK